MATASESRIHEGDPEDNANSGYFAPRPTIRRGLGYTPLDIPLATPIIGVKGGSSGGGS